MEQHTTFTEFLDKFPVRRFQKGEIIVCEGLEPRKCYAVKSGFAKVFLTTKNGEEKAVSFLASHDLFPLTWIFGKTDVALYYYQAYTDCEMYEIPREELTAHTESDPDMFRRLFAYVLELEIDLMQHVHSLEQAKASDKLMYAFNFLTRRFGKRITSTRTKMLLPLTQQDLANFLGLTRETTGAQLKELQHKGIINYQQQEYVVHTDRLRDMIEG
jgi:CRP/FNR family transcriptional regulator